MSEAKECFIICGGPSVTEDQIMAIKKWQHKTGGKVWAVNKVFLEVPWADYVFSMDTRFLKSFETYLEHCPENMEVITGTRSWLPPWAKYVPTNVHNSGAACIEAAAFLGFTTVYLVGADAHNKGGSHWHGGYHGIKACSNAPNAAEFRNHYKLAMQKVRKMANVFNCSPGTAITAVPTKDFDEVMKCLTHQA